MTEPPICKICGHHANCHRFAKPVKCSECPWGIWRDGAAGERFRGQMTDDKVWPKGTVEFKANLGDEIRWNGVLYYITDIATDSKGNKQITISRVGEDK